MGLHTGEGVLGGDDYVGIDVNRAARVAGATLAEGSIFPYHRAGVNHPSIPCLIGDLDLHQQEAKGWWSEQPSTSGSAS
jgi:hypothetical protein